MREPVVRVGITTGQSAAWNQGGRYYESYAAAVQEAGGVPVRLSPSEEAPAAALLNQIDCLLLTGGLDVDLTSFVVPHELARDAEGAMAFMKMKPEPARDRLEIPLAAAALEAHLPVLGICRGCQVLNVTLGGSLLLDIATEVPDAIEHRAGLPPDEPSGHHQVEIDGGSRLAAACGLHGLRPTNSRHHQAVKRPVPAGVKAVAFCADDGIVEAIEVDGASFAIGVQWHPERAADAEVRALYRPLFTSFLDAARR